MRGRLEQHIHVEGVLQLSCVRGAEYDACVREEGSRACVDLINQCTSGPRSCASARLSLACVRLVSRVLYPVLYYASGVSASPTLFLRACMSVRASRVPGSGGPPTYYEEEFFFYSLSAPLR